MGARNAVFPARGQSAAWRHTGGGLELARRIARRPGEERCRTARRRRSRQHLISQIDFAITKRRSPAFLLGFSRCNSLTMSYFHTGTRTIIGAEAFHCPVRDGKEWDHLAMVIRHNLLPSSPTD